MTEITAETVEIETRRIYWFAFIGALVTAPFVVALFCFWAIIPVFAIPLGVPTYFIFGAPLFALTIRYVGPYASATMLAGFLANLISHPFVALYDTPETAGFVVGFGMFVAPLWGLAFGKIYRLFAGEYV